MWQLPKNKPNHQYRIIYNNTQNAFDTAEVLKTFKIQQCIGFFVIVGFLELFKSDAQISDPQCGTIREAGINFKNKKTWRDN